MYDDAAIDTYYPVTSFCSDLSFWHDKMFERDLTKNYTYLNSTGYENKDLCESKEKFYCQKSRMCVPKSFMCDGSVNCKYAEDEELELCKATFSEGATLKCQEANRTNFQIWIYAVPCNGILGESNVFNAKEFHTCQS